MTGLSITVHYLVLILEASVNFRLGSLFEYLSTQTEDISQNSAQTLDFRQNLPRSSKSFVVIKLEFEITGL